MSRPTVGTDSDVLERRDRSVDFCDGMEASS
jgi:hypothetical protein